MMATQRPGTDEYAPSLAGYVARITDGEDVQEVLAGQLGHVVAWLEEIQEARGDFRYAPGKWSIKEVVGHLSDTERIFAYRLLRIGRGDATPLPGFDDQAYVPEMRAGERSLVAMSGAWSDVRRATLSLFRSMPAPAWNRRGVASGQPISVRALAYVIAGHTRHHLEVLKTRYSG